MTLYFWILNWTGLNINKSIKRMSHFSTVKHVPGASKTHTWWVLKCTLSITKTGAAQGLSSPGFNPQHQNTKSYRLWLFCFSVSRGSRAGDAGYLRYSCLTKTCPEIFTLESKLPIRCSRETHISIPTWAHDLGHFCCCFSLLVILS